jgi:xylulokinase
MSNRPTASRTVPAVLGIDLGTTSVKAACVGRDGRLLGLGRAAIRTLTPGPGIAEQDPADWWRATVSAVRAALAACGGVAALELLGICVVGQGPTTVAVDGSGGSLGMAMTWLDTRGTAEAASLSFTIGLPTWQLGSLPHERWVARHDPERHAAAAAFLSSWDWLTLRLSGETVRAVPPVSAHPTDATLRAGGADPARFGRAVEWATQVGVTLPGASAELGILAGTPVVSGGNDALASFHGAGLVDRGDSVDTGGTSGGLGVYWDRELDVPGTYRAPAGLPGLWLYGGAMNAIGKSVDWVSELLAPGGGPAADELVADAEGTPPGAGGLVFLPYLAGERAPIEDGRARGMFAGLGIAHGRGHLARAVLEAGGFALRHVAEPIRASGIQLERLVMSGATVRLHPAAQMRADILDLPVDIPAVPDTAAVGAGILAAVGTGAHPDARTAIRAMVRITARLEPRTSTRAGYDELYAVYRELYPRTADLMHRLADIGDHPPAQ